MNYISKLLKKLYLPKREDTVVAKHPNYQSTYAPGVVVKISSDRVYQVRFYDGTEGLISKTETHHVEPDRFEKVVDFILNLEQRWIGETIIARDDRSGIYKLGFLIKYHSFF